MVALVIIFNHKFDKNIPILDDIYSDRFKHIFYIVPFYTGTKENVITVYDSSFNFQGYIAQAYQVLKSKGDFEHYMFVGDDVLLNPAINENNYKEQFCIDTETSFFPCLEELSTIGQWPYLKRVFDYSIVQDGLEITKELPDREHVLNKFEQNHLSVPRIRYQDVYRMPQRNHYTKGIMGTLWYRLDKYKAEKMIAQPDKVLEFPLVTGYSDLIIVPKSIMPQFCHLCGVFAAGDLFVETAIATAIIITSKGEVQTQEKINKKGLLLWHKDREEFEEKYEASFNKLYDNFPKDTLYVHPVKLSKWKRD